MPFTTPLITLARAELPNARFHRCDTARVSTGRVRPTPRNGPGGRAGLAVFPAGGRHSGPRAGGCGARRANSNKLALRLRRMARYRAMPRLSNVEKLIGRSGWLKVSDALASADPHSGSASASDFGLLADDGRATSLTRPPPTIFFWCRRPSGAQASAGTGGPFGGPRC